MRKVIARIAMGAALVSACSSTPLPSATFTPSPSMPSATASPTTAAARIQGTGAIDTAFTTPAGDYTSTGDYLVWATGSRIGPTAPVAPDLYASLPGKAPELLYDNPNRDSQLHPIVGDGSEVAFIEENFRRFGYGGWKLWYIARPSAPAVEIAHGTFELVPGIALRGRWLAWTSGTSTTSQLNVLNLTTMTQQVLLSSPMTTTQYYYPAIDGDRLVYCTVELAPDFQSDERHVYLVDLTDPQAKPRRLDTAPSAYQPTIVGDTVVWKESDPRLSAEVSGSLIAYSLSTGQRRTLTLRPGAPPTIDGYGVGFMMPSLNDRYLAAWTDSFDGDRILNLADLDGKGLLTILDLGKPSQDPHDVLVRPVLHGNLLAYIFGPAKGHLELRWVGLSP